MDSGVQYVMTYGAKQMQMVSVDSLDTHQEVSMGLHVGLVQEWISIFSEFMVLVSTCNNEYISGGIGGRSNLPGY